MDAPKTFGITATEDLSLDATMAESNPDASPPLGNMGRERVNSIVEGANDADRNKHVFAVDRTKAERVPCPRLSGASFGIGGLIAFHNGGVSDLWSWFQKDSQAKKATARNSPDLLKDASLSYKHPRTMLDLMNMNAAAKIAQWGEDFDVNETKTPTCDDDCDGDSSANADSETDDETSSTEYDDCFANEEYSTTDPRDKITSSDPYQSDFRKRLPKKHVKKGSLDSNPIVGPCTHPFEPFVVITHRLPHLVMNGQCPLLAKSWQLGAWWLTKDGSVPIPSPICSTLKPKSPPSIEDNGWGWVHQSLQNSTSPGEIILHLLALLIFISRKLSLPFSSRFPLQQTSTKGHPHQYPPSRISTTPTFFSAR